jgi:hypothetical protein
MATLRILWATCILVLLAATTHAAGPQSKCLVSKNKCVAKKAGSLIKCEEKAETPGKPTDPNTDGCVDKAKAKFDGGTDPTKGCFAKLESKTPNDCVTTGDTAALETTADACVEQLVTAIDPGTTDQSKCNVGKKKCAAKKLAGILKCYQKAETPGKPGDPNDGGCLDKVKAKYDGGTEPTKGCFAKLESKSGSDCLAPLGDSPAVEAIVDNSCAGAFVAALVAVTTTTSTTTTTLPPGTFGITTLTGSTNCGGGGLVPAPSGPFSGEIDSDMGGTTKIVDLGLGCLYIGGGGATSVPPSRIPDGATSIFGTSGTGSLNLLANAGTSPANCTLGAGPGKHCIGGTNTGMACALDADCGGFAGSCALDGNCYFGPPLPILNGPLSTCVLNAIQTDASGTVTPATGDAILAINLSSRVYLTGNSGSPCPQCVAGTCNYGPGTTCSGVGSQQTTLDCLPPPGAFLAPLPVNLAPLTTGHSFTGVVDGNFCSPQRTPGAFGKSAARAIKQTGSPAGDLTDAQAHQAVLGYSFCIPATTNAAIDPSADLPGPGSVGLDVNAQLAP